MDRGNRLFFDQNFDRFLTSIFGRFGVVLGCQVGVILGPFGGQDRPRSVQNASWKPINMKIVNFAPVLRFPLPERCCWPQDGLQNAPRSAQDGSKRLLKSNFFALENRLKFGLVLGSDFGRFWLPNPSQKTLGDAPPFCILKAFVFQVVLCIASRWRKSRPRGSKTPPRAPQEAPRGPQERPRRLQQSLKRPQEPVKRAISPPKSSQEPPKTPTRLFRSTWPGSRFRKIQKIEIMAPKGIDHA